MQQLLLATRNAHKTREIQEILGRDFEVRDLSAHPEVPETPESGKTLEENAILKAIAVSKILPDLIIADDSGLEVDALGGAPGIFSARYAGKNANDKENIAKLLRELAQTGAKPGQYSTRFRCVLALAREGHVLGIFAGKVEGKIVNQPRGQRGFGYDPIFLPDGFGQTFAELPVATKNRISHRAKAIASLREALAG